MKITWIFPALLLAALVGCDSEGTMRPPPTNIRVFHGASNFDTLRLLRERNLATTVGFGRGSNESFDSGQYDFTFQALLAGIQPLDLFQFSATLPPLQISVIVATSVGDDLSAFVVPIDNVELNGTTARYTVIHGNPILDSVDIYIVPPGTALSTVTPQGTTQFGPTPAQFEVAEGDHQIYLTPVGDPDTVLYESFDFTVAAGTDKRLVIFDPGGQSLANIDIADLIENGAARLLQTGIESRYRVINAVDDRNEAREIYLNEETTPIIAAPLPFGEPTASAVIASEGFNVKLTPTGNPGTVESSTLLAPVPGLSYLTMWAGDTTDGIQPVTLVEDLRSVFGQATVRVLHGAGMFDGSNVYITAPGTNVTLVPPNVPFIRAPANSDRLPFVPGDYEITIRDRLTGTVTAGPIPVTLNDGGVYGIYLVNGDDGASVDVNFLYDLAL